MASLRIAVVTICSALLDQEFSCAICTRDRCHSVLSAAKKKLIAAANSSSVFAMRSKLPSSSFWSSFIDVATTGLPRAKYSYSLMGSTAFEIAHILNGINATSNNAIYDGILEYSFLPKK